MRMEKVTCKCGDVFEIDMDATQGGGRWCHCVGQPVAHGYVPQTHIVRWFVEHTPYTIGDKQ